MIKLDSCVIKTILAQTVEMTEMRLQFFCAQFIIPISQWN